MNKAILTLLNVFITILCFSQATENNKLIELAKGYKDFMFRNEPPKNFVKELELNLPANLKTTSDFILQTIISDNDLLKQQYLVLPDTSTLKSIYIIRNINFNLREENPVDNNKLIDSLRSSYISKYELIDCYYSILFASVGNKNKPFNFSKIDFTLKEYNLTNDTEKGIFFLECMSYCGTEIWGYMNIVKPANTKEALEYIRKYPKFNGLKYYQYTDLNFPDFEIKIIKDKGKQSYKAYYINKYYELLLSHLICLKREGKKEKDINDLLLGSILKDRIFYKYTKHKETLENIFTEQKQD